MTKIASDGSCNTVLARWLKKHMDISKGTCFYYQLMQILHIDYTLLGFESRLGHNAVGDNQLLQPVRLLVSPNNIRLTFYRSTE